MKPIALVGGALGAAVVALPVVETMSNLGKYNSNESWGNGPAPLFLDVGVIVATVGAGFTGKATMSSLRSPTGAFAYGVATGALATIPLAGLALLNIRAFTDLEVGTSVSVE